MRLLVNPKEHDNYCMFCKRKLEGKIFCEINTPLFPGMRNLKWKKTRFIHQIHLSCGYNFLKQLKNPGVRDKDLIREIEEKWLKEMIVEKLQ